MSSIDTSNINSNFPVQGADNPSQGFRDNFGYIKIALNKAKEEITLLQNNPVGVVTATSTVSGIVKVGDGLIIDVDGMLSINSATFFTTSTVTKLGGIYGVVWDNIALGTGAGAANQQDNAIAIGRTAGSNSQSTASIAIGFAAGFGSQGGLSIAIGNSAGVSNQQAFAVALGNGAGFSNQGNNTVAIGDAAGEFNQGDYSIAIGTLAGTTNQAEKSIVINASGVQLDAATSGTLHIDPIRPAVSPNVVYYDTSTKEVTYSPFVLASYTTATLSSIISPAVGSFVFVTNAPGGAQPCYYDGTSWYTVNGRISATW